MVVALSVSVLRIKNVLTMPTNCKRLIPKPKRKALEIKLCPYDQTEKHNCDYCTSCLLTFPINASRRASRTRPTSATIPSKVTHKNGWSHCLESDRTNLHKLIGLVPSLKFEPDRSVSIVVNSVVVPECVGEVEIPRHVVPPKATSAYKTRLENQLLYRRIVRDGDIAEQQMSVRSLVLGERCVWKKGSFYSSVRNVHWNQCEVVYDLYRSFHHIL